MKKAILLSSLLLVGCSGEQPYTKENARRDAVTHHAGDVLCQKFGGFYRFVWASERSAGSYFECANRNRIYAKDTSKAEVAIDEEKLKTLIDHYVEVNK